MYNHFRYLDVSVLNYIRDDINAYIMRIDRKVSCECTTNINRERFSSLLQVCVQDSEDGEPRKTGGYSAGPSSQAGMASDDWPGAVAAFFKLYKKVSF